MPPGEKINLSLSADQVNSFASSSKELQKLVKESEELDSKLTTLSQTKEWQRSKLGAFHSAAQLNYHLEAEPANGVKDVLELMHNSSLRVVEFIESYIKAHPDEISPHVKDEASKFSFHKYTSVSNNVDYEIRHKSGFNIVVSIANKGNEDETMEIEYLDPGEPDQGPKNLHTERLSFYFKPLGADTKLVLYTKEGGETQYPTKDLDLSLETNYVNNLYQALHQYNP